MYSLHICCCPGPQLDAACVHEISTRAAGGRMQERTPSAAVRERQALRKMLLWYACARLRVMPLQQHELAKAFG